MRVEIAPDRRLKGPEESFSMYPDRTRKNCKKVRSCAFTGTLIRELGINLDFFYRIQTALGLDLDVMVLDFEDGVALNQKPKARQLVAETLLKQDFGRTERTVRINSIKSGENLFVIF